MTASNDDRPRPADGAQTGPTTEGANKADRDQAPEPLQPTAADGEHLVDAYERSGGDGYADLSRAPTSEEAKPQKEVLNRPRRVRLPVILFLATCLSTFWAGATQWLAIPPLELVRQTLLAHWQDGLIYMACVLAILLAHEMGHFVATVRYGIAASFPYFIPFPISPIGTMGAVIGMDGLKADRKELFDIGLAGPLAGLVIAVPMTWIGLAKLDFTQIEYGPFAVDLPLFARLAMHYIQPPGYSQETVIWFSQFNPYLVAGWVGLLITGLNMIPVSQLDGGHVSYALLGRKAHWIARLIVVLAVFQVVISGTWSWTLMILLVLFIGPDHPPTRDDNVPLGRTRIALGCASILIPVFCFPLRLLIFPPGT
jgi:Zn-dependent protease